MRISTTGLGILLCLASGSAACGGKLDYVKTDATLGKVVVYRNGVAYFERRAKLQGDELRLKVPTDKIDDFLKSLTVRDAATGKSLPISFPRKGREKTDVPFATICGASETCIDKPWPTETSLPWRRLKVRRFTPPLLLPKTASV